MASATDKLQWILEFKGRGLSQLRQELKSANTLVKTLSSSVRELNKLTNRKHNIKINTGAANNAIQKLIKTNEKLKSQIDRKHKIKIDDVGVRILQGRVKTLQKQLNRLSSKKITIRGTMKIDGAGRNFRGGRGGGIGGVKSVGGGGGGFGSILGSVGSGTMAAAGVAVAAGGAVISKFKDFMEEAVDTVAEKENIIRNYTVMLGSAKAAQAEYFKAAAFSQKTDLTFKQTTEIQQRLINAGYRNTKDNKMLDKALYGIGDLAALQPKNQREGFITQFTAAMTKTAQSGRLNTRAVNSATLRGVNRNDIYESIRGQLKLDKKADIEKLISKGQVGANVGIAAIEEAILKKTGKSKLGEYAVGAAGTTGGLISNLQELPQNIIRSIDFEEMSGFKKFRDFLKELTGEFNVFEGKGLGIRDFIADILNGGFEVITLIGGAIKKLVNSFTETYKYFMSKSGLGSSFFSEKLEKMKNILGDVATAIGTVAGWLLPKLIWGWGKLIDMAGFMINAFKSVGKWLKSAADGVVYAFKFIGKYIVNFWNNLGDGLSNFFQGLWDVLTLDISEGRAKMEKAFESHDITKQTKDEIAFEQAVEEDKNKEIEYNRRLIEKKRLEETKNKMEDALSDENKIKDNLKGENEKRGGRGGGGDNMGGGKFSPMINDLQTAHLLKKTIPALTAAMIQGGSGAPMARPVVAPIDAVKQQNNFNVPVSLNFTINGDNKTDEIAQKVNIELTRIFGRITVNPTPGVL